MGRPRNDSGEPCAIERIVDAFWSLLEENTVKEITISMVAAKAGCNRGTFYYHFSDMDDLLTYCIEAEMVGKGDDSYAITLFSLLTKPSSELLIDLPRQQMVRKLCLLITQGGMEIVDTKMKALILKMWQDILCEEGCSLSFESRLIVEYSVSGMIALFLLVYRMVEDGDELPEHIDMDVFQSMARIQLAQLSRCENVEPGEMAMRLKMYDKSIRTRS